jgi:uncharacterized membrane protein YphA (DoxX/SURF4 family)
MVLSRRLTHALLGATFVATGVDSLVHPHDPTVPGGHVGSVDDNGMLAVDGGAWPLAPRTVVRATGAVQVLAGALLVCGRWPRLATAGLLATVLPTTTGGHRFWESEPGEPGPTRRLMLVKDMGLVAGLLLVGLDTGGAPSLPWRTRHRLGELDVRTALHRAEGAVGSVLPHVPDLRSHTAA